MEAMKEETVMEVAAVEAVVMIANVTEVRIAEAFV